VAVLVVILSHMLLMLAGMPIFTILVTDIKLEDYISALRFTNIHILAYGLVAGLCSYGGVYIWRNRIWERGHTHFLLPLRMIISMGLVLFGWVSLSIGLIVPILIIAMGRHG